MLCGVKSTLHPFRVVLLAGALAVAGCIAVEAPPPAPAAGADHTAVSDRLYFGRAIPAGGEVTEADWDAFVAEVIAPRFPDGFTIHRASGHWRGDDGAAVSEGSFILEVVHRGDAAADRAIDEIGRAYRERFDQDAVMRVRTPVAQTFWRR
jgi:hypothetical protein